MARSKKIVVANYVGSGWNALMGLAFVPIYIQYLGIESYGLVGIFAMIQAWMVVLDGGMTPTFSRETARFRAGVHSAQSIRDLMYTMELLYLVIIGGVSVGILIFAPWLVGNWIHAESLSFSSVVNALQIIGLVIGLRWLTGLYRGGIIGLQGQVWLNVCTAFFATLRGAGAVAVLAFISPKISAFFIYQGIVAALEALALGIRLRRTLPRSPHPATFRFARLRDVWRFAAGMISLTILGTLLTQSDKLLLSKMLPLGAFAIYAVASSVASALYGLVLPISNASYPLFTEFVARGDIPNLTIVFHKFAQITSLMLIPVSLVLILFAKSLLLMWTGNAELATAAAPLVSLLVLGNMLHGLMHTSYTLQLAYGETFLNVIVNICLVAALLPALYFAVPRYGALGAAAIWVAVNLAYLLVMTPLAHRTLLPKEMWQWCWRDVMLPLVAALACVCIARYAEPSHPPGSSRFQGVGLSALAMCAAFAAATLALPLGRNEARHTAGHIRRAFDVLKKKCKIRQRQ